MTMYRLFCASKNNTVQGYYPVGLRMLLKVRPCSPSLASEKLLLWQVLDGTALTDIIWRVGHLSADVKPVLAPPPDL